MKRPIALMVGKPPRPNESVSEYHARVLAELLCELFAAKGSTNAE